jgi:hypothetical protein
MTELAFDHNEPCYFAVAAMPLEMANNYLKVRTRNGSGLLKYWHVPVQFGAEVNSRLLPFLYIGAYARYLARAHHLDLNGWEAVLLAEKCIQCSPIEGDEAAEKKARSILGRKRRKESGVPPSPCIPFCAKHLEQHYTDPYGHSPFFELLTRVINALESLPLNTDMHRVPFAPSRKSMSDDITGDLVSIPEFNKRYDVASERQKVHCQFAVTADFMTVWRKLSLNTRAGLRKRARKEGPSPAKGTLVPKPSAIRTGPSAPAADARLPSDEETAPASFAPSSGKQQNGTTAATAGDSPGGAALAAPAVAAAATKTVSNDAVPTEAKEQAAACATESTKRSREDEEQDDDVEFGERQEYLIQLVSEGMRYRSNITIPELLKSVNGNAKKKGADVVETELRQLLKSLEKSSLLMCDGDTVYCL